VATGCRVLLIDQGSPQRDNLLGLLASIEGFACRAVSWESAMAARAQTQVAELLVAVSAPVVSGARRMIEWLRDHPAPIPKLAVLPSDADESLLALAGVAADDFILAPVRHSELRYRVLRLMGRRQHASEAVAGRLSGLVGMEQLVGQDPAFLAAIGTIPRIAECGLPVLITGETGTGKELCARAIHHVSARRGYPFVAVDCGALPENLFENEFFGHARGAYTDAHADQRGLVATAEGGTLFLDEIDSLAPGSQAKLLRFLQDGMYRPLGSDRPVKADVQVIAASNRSLEECVQDRQFRNDLYYRISVVQLHLPPLRDRSGDIHLLTDEFLRVPPPGGLYKTLTPAAHLKLSLYAWPGNVRELFNVMQRAILFSEGPDILPGDIGLPTTTVELCAVPPTFRLARAGILEDFERSYVLGLLAKHGGNVTHAAREAGKERRAFGRLVKKYTIPPGKL
jgi:DNA-binding NtrC family response regulator